MVDAAKKGSICAVAGSGMSVMSDSLIAFQPAIEEPSNICPSAKVSSSIMVTSKVTCCHLPRGSVKRKSTYFTSLSLIALSTSLAVFIRRNPLVRRTNSGGGRACAQGIMPSNRIQAGLAGPDPNGFLDGRYKNLAIADPTGLGCLADGVYGWLDKFVRKDNLDLHLGKEIDDVFGAAIEFGMALLTAETLGFGHRDALESDVLKSFLHVVELERLDDRFDLLHGHV